MLGVGVETAKPGGRRHSSATPPTITTLRVGDGSLAVDQSSSYVRQLLATMRVGQRGPGPFRAPRTTIGWATVLPSGVRTLEDGRGHERMAMG